MIRYQGFEIRLDDEGFWILKGDLLNGPFNSAEEAKGAIDALLGL